MTSVVANVKGYLTGLERKIRQSRGLVDPGAHATYGSLGPMKSSVAGIEGRCREQKAAAANLIAGSQADRFQLVEKLATAEERAKDLMTQLCQVKDCLEEVQMALYAAEKAAADTAAAL